MTREHTHGSIADIVRHRASTDPDRPAFTGVTFVGQSDDRVERTLTYRELDSRAIAVAGQMLALAQPGDRALLVFRQGVEFAVGFLACLYAGIIAVPAPSPRQGLWRARLAAIAADASPALALLAGESSEVLDGILPAERFIRTDRIHIDGSVDPRLFQTRAVDIALLQYSSGTTGEAKGIVITHGNLLHQARVICKALDPSADDVVVTWLPLYHDMGLISGIVMPLYLGVHSWLMSPEMFVARPLRWLKCIMDARASFCVAPDFAYAYCAQRIDAAAASVLDLSCLQHVVTGAEPVRIATIDAFCERFSPAGFRRSTFFPAYGLAEGTLLVTGAEGGVRSRSVEQAGLPSGVLPRAVSCGKPMLDMEVIIVDRDSHTRCAEGTEGEIWVRGGSVATGYWRNEERSADTFGARLSDGNGPWMRTGDTGFLHDGELFIRGRIKDLIKVRGQGVHPEDVESVLVADHPSLTGALAVFAVDDGVVERVVVVVELGKGRAQRSGHHRLRESLLRAGGLNGLVQIDEVVFVDKPLPRTTSGKVMRSTTRERYDNGQLDIVDLWRRSSVTAQHDDLSYHLQWISEFVEETTGRWPSPQDRFSALGLDAAARHGLIHRLRVQVGTQEPISELLAFETPRDLAWHLATTHGRGEIPGSAQVVGRHLDAPDLSDAPSAHESVAIIGMACRFAGADGVKAFWENICSGLDTVTEVPHERWSAANLYDPNPLSAGKMSTRWGGFLRDIELFDRKFFGMSARESSSTDPAHRIMMELGWEVLEDAGVPASSMDGSLTGVYVGISGCDYSHLQFGDDASADAYAGIGCALTNAASRVSYSLNLRGPALAVDTACSSALSALHMAVAAVRSGEVEMALAGGVNIILAPSVTMALSKAGMMAPDGRCKAFDQRANGYVRAEGAGFVLLKPLSKALSDGDRIYAVVRAVASNQDGRGSSLSAPNGDAQQLVIREACRRAGIAPTEYTYVEAHGTGTPIGDPIELNALGEVFRTTGKLAVPVKVGSVKTNIGHAESAAGIASIIKTALILHRRVIPPNLHFETPNPLIRFEEFDIEVPTSATAIPDSVPRPLAGVNGFGIGGTNVHAVLQAVEHKAVSPIRSSQPLPPWTIPVSARTDQALRNMLAALADWIEENPDADPRDVVATLVRRRDQLPRRAVVCADSRMGAVQSMRAHSVEGSSPDVIAGQAAAGTRRVAFVYSGQGPQWHAMGRALYAAGGVFRRELDHCASFLDPLTGWSLVAALHADEAESRMGRTDHAQPSLFALQYALGRHLKAMGMVPDVVVGHSLGEIAAAEAAGLVTLEEACRLVVVRGELMQEITGQGAMASVELPAAELLGVIETYGDRLSLAASNGPSTSVLSGDQDAVSEVLDRLDARGILSVRLEVNYAFHSAQTEPLLPRLRKATGSMVSRSPSCAFYSTVEARSLDRLDHDYWSRNMRERVSFRETIEAMARDSTDLYIEISPHPVLSGAISRTLVRGSFPGSAIPTLQRTVPDELALVRASAAAYVVGGHHWRGLVASDQFLDELPRYQWDRQRYWLDGPHRQLRERYVDHPLVGRRVPGAQPTWEILPDPNAHPWLAGVRLNGQERLPLAAFIEIALETGRIAAAPASVCSLREIRLSFGAAVRAQSVLQAVVHREGGDGWRVLVSQHVDDSAGKLAGWSSVFRSALEVSGRSKAELIPLGVHAVPSADDADVSDRADIYRLLAEMGLECAPARQVIARGWRGSDGVTVEIDQKSLAAASRLRVPHPIVDAVEQAARLVAGVHVPLSLEAIDAVHLHSDVGTARFVTCRPRARPMASGRQCVDAWVMDPDGSVLAVFDAMLWSESRQGVDTRIAEDADDWRCQVAWNESELPEARLADNRGWVIVPDRKGACFAVRESLIAAGARVELVSVPNHAAGDASARVADFRRGLQSAMDALRARGSDLVALVDMSALDHRSAAEISRIPPDDDDFAVAFRIIQIAQVIGSDQAKIVPRVWTVSRGARAVLDGDPCESPLGAMAWGASRSLSMEHRELRCTCVDVDDADLQASALVRELLCDGAADQIAFRGDRRFIGTLRYARHAPSRAPGGMQGRRAYALAIAPEGVVPCSAFHRRSPEERDLLVRVSHATADPAAALDREGAGSSVRLFVGEVEEAGAGVGGIAPGRRIACLASAGLATHVLVDSRLAVTVPDEADSKRVAALLPVLEAMFAVQGRGGVRRGGSVLIRDLDGRGVAAASVARHLGLRTYALVAPRLRELYASQKLAGLFDLLDPLAEDVLRDATQGGVDLLLDVSGGWITQGARAVRPFGRIALTHPGASPVLERLANVSVEAVDLAAAIASAPEMVRSMLADAIAFAASGGSPHAGGHDEVGYSGPAVSVIEIPDFPELAGTATGIHGDGSYLITGGLGGLGLAVAERLARAGARHLVLVGRSAPDLQARDRIAAVESHGAEVVTARIDMGDGPAVRGLLDDFGKTWPPLRGVVHAAGLLANRISMQLGFDEFRQVLTSKVLGVCHLEGHPATQAVDFFVNFSSLASMLGSPGQANYAAANAFLETMSSYRVAGGRSGLAVAWGPWSDVGMAAAAYNLARLADFGIGVVGLGKGLDLLETFIIGRAAGVVGVLPMDWETWASGRRQLACVPYFLDVVPEIARSHVAGQRIDAAQLVGMEPNEQLPAVTAAVVSAVAGTLRIDPSTVEVDVPLVSMGLDSIVALELKERIESLLDIVVRTSSLVGGQSIARMAEQFHAELSERASPPVSPTAPTDLAPVAPEPASELSREEIERLLAELDTDDEAH